MTQEIRLAAILARDGRLLLVREGGQGWALPGGVMGDAHEDVDAGMAAQLLAYGIRVPEIEETFLQTAYLPRPGGHAILNLYAPAEWEGEPSFPEGEIGWHAIEDLAALGMDADVHATLLAALGLAPDEAEARIAAAFANGAVPGAAGYDPGDAAEERFDLFVASRWRNGEAVDALVDALRLRGLRVYSFREAPDPLSEEASRLSPEAFMRAFEARDWRTDPDIRTIFEQDMAALRASDVLVLLLPAGTSSHIEAGIAFGLGKRCILVGEPAEAESLYLIFAERYATVDQYLESLS